MIWVKYVESAEANELASASGRVDRWQNKNPYNSYNAQCLIAHAQCLIAQVMKLKLSKALLVDPARPVDCRLISILCNPNVVSGTDCLIQGPLPSQFVQS